MLLFKVVGEAGLPVPRSAPTTAVVTILQREGADAELISEGFHQECDCHLHIIMPPASDVGVECVLCATASPASV